MTEPRITEPRRPNSPMRSLKNQINSESLDTIRPPNRFMTAIFWLIMGFLYLPLAWLVLQAFLNDPADLSSGFTLRWLMALFKSDALWEPLFNSLIIGFSAASLATLVGTLGAVGFGPFSSVMPRGLQALIMLPILVPEVITGLSLLLFFLLFQFELGMTTVILAHASFSASFVYFIMIEQLRKLDPNLGEAAYDLGAKPNEIFWKVILPNIIPGIIGGWLLSFTISFDDFLISFFTSGAGLVTLPLKIYSLMRIGFSPELNAMSLVLVALSTGLVLLLWSREQSRKWVIRGS
jgi:spermidine/putrescine transport system permease protein